MSDIVYRPRNDNVLVQVRVIDKPADSAIHMPQSSIEGKEFVVVAAGPKVTDLKTGDKVLMIGKPGTNYWEVPNATGLIIIKEENVVLAFDKE